jgi:hypothetical protein
VIIEECRHESAIVHAVLARRWPHGCDEELRQHGESCVQCTEARTIAAAFSDDHDALLAQLQVPAAGQVWWRSALRAHADAAVAARRPMLWLQGVAGACVVGIGAGLVGLGWASLRDAVAWLTAASSGLMVDAAALAPVVDTLRSSLLAALAIAGGLVLMPLVVYIALSDE